MMILAMLLAAAPASTGTVTLPLDEARSLLSTDVPPRAPISAAVVSQHLVGQVTGDSLEVTATFQIAVLDGASWSQLSLLKLDSNMTLLSGLSGEGTLITVHKDEVVFISRQPGTYLAVLKLSVRGTGGALHTAKFRRGADAREGSIHVETAGPEQTMDQGADVLSSAGQWIVSWKGRVQAPVAVAPPPMEPVVRGARVQVVSTVEGRARMTVEYRLGLDRDQALGLRLPPEWTLTRLSCNGAPRAVPPGREVSVTVGPQNALGHDGVVELTLERDLGVFHLSGRLNLSLPGASWPTSVLEVSVHLPNVFEYRRLGGSLEPDEKSEWTPQDMPGIALRYRQHLVASAGPTLELSYWVNLEKRYFRARAP